MSHKITITYPHKQHPEQLCTMMLPYTPLDNNLMQFTITRECVEDLLDLISKGTMITHTIE